MIKRKDKFICIKDSDKGFRHGIAYESTEQGSIANDDGYPVAISELEEPGKLIQSKFFRRIHDEESE